MPSPLSPRRTTPQTNRLVSCGKLRPFSLNVLGFPAGVLPITRVRAGEESDRTPGKDIVEQKAAKTEANSAGLPVGVQIAAPCWRDHVALAVMQAIENEVKANDDYPINALPLKITPTANDA